MLLKDMIKPSYHICYIGHEYVCAHLVLSQLSGFISSWESEHEQYSQKVMIRHVYTLKKNILKNVKTVLTRAPIRSRLGLSICVA